MTKKYHINDGGGGGFHTSYSNNDGTQGFNSMPSPYYGLGGGSYSGVLDNGWTPDGRMLFVDGTRTTVWLYDPCQQTISQVAGAQVNASRPSMGIPGDGTGPHVMWSAGASGSVNVMVKDISDLVHNTAQVFSGPHSTDPHPHMSDDATMVAHVDKDINGHAQVFVTKRDKSVGPVQLTTAGGTLTDSDHPHIGKDIHGNPMVSFRNLNPSGLDETKPSTYRQSALQLGWINPTTLAPSGFQTLLYVGDGQHQMVTNPSIHPDGSAVHHDMVDDGVVSGHPFGGTKDVNTSTLAVTTVSTATTDPAKVMNHLASKGVRRVK